MFSIFRKGLTESYQKSEISSRQYGCFDEILQFSQDFVKMRTVPDSNMNGARLRTRPTRAPHCPPHQTGGAHGPNGARLRTKLRRLPEKYQTPKGPGYWDSGSCGANDSKRCQTPKTPQKTSLTIRPTNTPTFVPAQSKGTKFMDWLTAESILSLVIICGSRCLSYSGRCRLSK